MGVYRQGETIVKAPKSENPNTSSSASSVKLTINCIGSLSEVCIQNKIPMPRFTEISDVGPPHYKEFTYQCQIASIITRATAGAKKQAKQFAAKEMLDRITHALPDLVAECNKNVSAHKAVADKDTSATKTYVQLRKLTRPKPNLVMKIEDYDLNIKNIMTENNVALENLVPYFSGEYTEDVLKQLLSKLKLDYTIEIFQHNPCVVKLALNTDVPFTLLASGTSFEDAREKVILRAFKYLETLTK